MSIYTFRILFWALTIPFAICSYPWQPWGARTSLRGATASELPTSLPAFQDATTIQVLNGIAFMRAGRFPASGGLAVIDVHDPRNPHLLHHLTVGQHGGIDVHSLDVVGTLAYALTREGLKIVDYEDPTTPVVRSTNYLGSSRAIDVDGHYAYVSYLERARQYCLGGGVAILDVSNPDVPVRIGMVADGSAGCDGGRALQVRGGLVYHLYGGLVITDVRNIANQSVLSRTPVYNYYGAIEVVDSLVYLYSTGVADSVLLEILDVEDPARPQRLGSYRCEPCERMLYGIAVAGTHAYLATSAAVDILDVSDPTLPRLIGTYYSPSAVYSIDVVGTLAYLGTANGLEIIDVSDPLHPTRVGGFPLAYFLPLIHGQTRAE